MSIVGAALAIIGNALFLWSLGRVLAASPTTRMPYFGPPQVTPSGAVAQRAVGAGLIAFGAALCFSVPLLTIVLALVAPLTAFVAIVRHNKRADAVRG